MTPARSAIPASRGTNGYTAPTETHSVRLLDLLQTVKRGPAWADRQLNFFGGATLPENDPLYYAGDIKLLERPCVSIVGTRKASPQGIARAARLTRELIRRGVVIVSGLAKGIDASAHTTAIEGGGRTVAVIGTPLSKSYPAENKRIQEAIWRDHLLVSPFAEGSQVYPTNFPQRNRIMAAVSDATVIIEADDNSGTLYQAVACQKIGRWLFILKSVVETQAWPKRFLAIKNTRVLENTEQIFDALNIQ